MYVYLYVCMYFVCVWDCEGACKCECDCVYICGCMCVLICIQMHVCGRVLVCDIQTPCANPLFAFSASVDCWDGPDGEPIIYHGFTLTSKIKVPLTRTFFSC